MYNIHIKQQHTKEWYHMSIIQYFIKINQAFIDSFEQSLKKQASTIKRQKQLIKNLKIQIKKLNGTFVESIPSDSISPKYNPFEVVTPPIASQVINSPSLNYLDIINSNNIKPSTKKAFDKLPNKSQNCPNCGSPAIYHYLHTKSQKRCKCCFKTFSFIIKKSDPTCYNCPYCKHKLVHRAKRSTYDVFVCKNKNCSYRKDFLKDNPNPHPCSKISYIFRKVNVDMDKVFNFIDEGNNININFKFRKFDLDILSKAIYFKVNLKLSTRDTAIALSELFNIKISHATIATYCTKASKLIKIFNTQNVKNISISNQLVADETYIKIKGKKHYVWIIYDLKNKFIVASHVSDKRTTEACLVVLTKLINAYGENIPTSITFASDMYSAYPLALQTISEYFNIDIEHIKVKGLEHIPGENYKARRAKQAIERLNRTFKASYRVTTGFGTLQGAKDSFELWQFFFNYIRKEYNSFSTRLSLNNVADSCNINLDFYIPDHWLYTLYYVQEKLIC